MSGSQVDELRAALFATGHRVTTPRRVVWTVIAGSEKHMTADEIAEQVRDVDSSVNLSSVYRSLSLFAELGLVRESNLSGSGPVHWELAHSDDHFHLRCRLCGKIDHHSGGTVNQIRTHLASDHGFAAERVDLVVTGVCPDCA